MIITMYNVLRKRDIPCKMATHLMSIVLKHHIEKCDAVWGINQDAEGTFVFLIDCNTKLSTTIYISKHRCL
jgi:hypothetical protein